MHGRRTTRRAIAALLSCAALMGAGTLYAQARRARAGEAIIGPFPDAHTALERASISDDAAVFSMLTTIRTGFPSFPSSATALRTDAAMRLALVRGLARVLPRIIASQPFVEAYAQVRSDAISTQVGSPPVDPALTRQDRISTLRADIEGYRLDLRAPNLSRSERNRIEDQIETAEDRLRPLEREANDQRTRDRDRAALASAQSEYEQRRAAAMATIDVDLPEDVRLAVARRLQTFVTVCGDVNFRAATTRNPAGVTTFTRPEDEARPKLWKLCFRAGRRPTDEARRLARSWLGSLAASGVSP